MNATGRPGDSHHLVTPTWRWPPPKRPDLGMPTPMAPRLGNTRPIGAPTWKYPPGWCPGPELAEATGAVSPGRGAPTWPIEISMPFSHTKPQAEGLALFAGPPGAPESPGRGALNWRFIRGRRPVSPGRGVWGPPISRSGRQTPRPGDVDVRDPPRPGDSTAASPRPGNPGVPRRPDPAIAPPLPPRPGDAGAHTWRSHGPGAQTRAFAVRPPPRPGDGPAPSAQTWRCRRPDPELASADRGLFPDVGAHTWQIEIFMSFSHTKCLVGGLPVFGACREGLESPGMGAQNRRLALEGPLQTPGLGAKGPPISRCGRRTPRPGDANVQNPPRPGDPDGLDAQTRRFRRVGRPHPEIPSGRAPTPGDPGWQDAQTRRFRRAGHPRLVIPADWAPESGNLNERVAQTRRSGRAEHPRLEIPRGQASVSTLFGRRRLLASRFLLPKRLPGSARLQRAAVGDCYSSVLVQVRRDDGRRGVQGAGLAGLCVDASSGADTTGGTGATGSVDASSGADTTGGTGVTGSVDASSGADTTGSTDSTRAARLRST